MKWNILVSPALAFVMAGCQTLASLGGWSQDPPPPQRSQQGQPPAKHPEEKDLRDSAYYGLDEHRKNYIAVASYNQSANDETLSGEIDEFEWHFQLSLRRDFYEWAGKDDRITFAYTNRSFWQVTKRSSPFRTTDHEPELFYEHDMNDNMTVQFGVVHQSNGESSSDSRSWNRVFLHLIGHSEGWFDHLTPPDGIAWRWSIKPWAVFRKSRFNQDIGDYIGYGEIGGDIAWGAADSRPTISVRLRNNFDFSKNRGAVEVTYSHGIAPGCRLFAQYFNGYGESLVDYNDSANRFSIGFELSRAH